MTDRRNIHILLVDDHQMIIEGYKNVLSNFNIPDTELTIDASGHCDEAWERIQKSDYQVVFLDINFPVQKGSKIFSGEDLGVKIRKEYPDIRIVILTVLEDGLRLQNILSNINPDGFILKGETNSRELLNCLERVINNHPYYGPKIAKVLRSGVKGKNFIDETDRIMLHQLSLGTKTKDLTKFVHLSLRAVEDRKKRLKEVFGVSGRGNKALLDKARESGYI